MIWKGKSHFILPFTQKSHPPLTDQLTENTEALLDDSEVILKINMVCVSSQKARVVISGFMLTIKAYQEH